MYEIKFCSKLSLKNPQPISVNGLNEHYTVGRLFMYTHRSFSFFLFFGFVFFCWYFFFFPLMDSEESKESFWLSLQNKLYVCLDTQFGQLPKLRASRSPEVVSFALKMKTVGLPMSQQNKLTRMWLLSCVSFFPSFESFFSSNESLRCSR